MGVIAIFAVVFAIIGIVWLSVENLLKILSPLTWPTTR